MAIGNGAAWLLLHPWSISFGVWHQPYLQSTRIAIRYQFKKGLYLLSTRIVIRRAIVSCWDSRLLYVPAAQTHCVMPLWHSLTNSLCRATAARCGPRPVVPVRQSPTPKTRHQPYPQSIYSCRHKIQSGPFLAFRRPWSETKWEDFYSNINI